MREGVALRRLGCTSVYFKEMEDVLVIDLTYNLRHPWMLYASTNQLLTLQPVS